MQKALEEKDFPLYCLQNIGQKFYCGEEANHVLQNINLTIEREDTIAIVGSSGSGKSSLLHILGTLAEPSSGEIFFSGQNLCTLSSEKKAQLRNKEIGFVFQHHYMLPEFTSLENVAMQGIIGGASKEAAFERAAELLDLVGLHHRKKYNTSLLSGGEKQRVAIARAIFNSPQVLLADEPTGNLDVKTGYKIIDLLQQLNNDKKMTMVVVTHNLEFSAQMKQCLELKSGELYDQTC